jgi:hypothetical protein
LLQDTVIAVKLVTGFDRVNAAAVVEALQTVALLHDLSTDDAVEDLPARLARPIQIPSEFLAPFKSRALPPPVVGGPSAAELEQQRQLAAMRERRTLLSSTYAWLMGLRPEQLEVGGDDAAGEVGRPPVERADEERDTHADGVSSLQFIRISDSALANLDDDRSQLLESLELDPRRLPVSEVVETVKRQWVDVSSRLVPGELQDPARVYRLGGHVFAARDEPAPVEIGANGVPGVEFSHAITRPVGVGDLQVVRQKLTGYEAGEISHIENVLQGERLRRSTRREEVNELTLTDETDSSQSQERDQQSTDRNELATEIQKETSQQTVSSQDQTTSTDYGKLVENSKTNYARSVTDRAVNTVTQMVKQQRVQRERKTFTEKALHDLDNRRGSRDMRGIYQWVDKKYNVRILNYGKRLLYDVVVPEPASFLIQSLKDAAQPEGFQLTKPSEPWFGPSALDPSNYAYYAALYGVTGSVSPPPDEFTQTVAQVEAPDVARDLKAFGTTMAAQYFAGFKIEVPQDYQAIGGFVQHVNVHYVKPDPGPILEFFVGESTFIRFVTHTILNKSFTLNHESGQIPVTVASLERVAQFSYAVGINCRRTDRAMKQWQLTTHAAIMAGYQRQLADYEDKLARYTSAARAQMAATANYAHDPSVEQQELKKAFIYLLLGEHPGSILPTPAPAPLPPSAWPPDPVAVKNWGAMVAFFERAFEWENIMYTYYPYYWGRPGRWEESILIQDSDPQFEAFLKAGAARVVIPARPGFEAALAHYQETGDIWLGEEIPDMFSDYYVSIINEIKARNYAPGEEVCVAEWDVRLPTTLVMLKHDTKLPQWDPEPCGGLPPPQPSTPPAQESWWTWFLKWLGLKP